MPEQHPDDALLLALEADEETGVEYIPTGLSPYYLEFRRLVHRTLRAAARANDLRVYQDGDLTVGIRAGSCLIADTAVDFPGAEHVAVEPSATTYLRLDADGVVRQDAALPARRETFIPLARVEADASRIIALDDLRGRAFLAAPSPASVGVTQSIGFVRAEPLGASSLGNLVAAAAIDGEITGVVLSVQSNLVSSDEEDAIAVVVKVNGAPVTSTHPAMPVSAGAGFRSTARDEGVQAVIRTDGAALVRRGDIITVDLIRDVAGVAVDEAAGIAVAVALRSR